MRHQLEIRAELQSVEVHTTDEQGSWELSIDGQRHRLQLAQAGAGHLRLRRGDRWLDCWVARTPNGTWVWAEGRARLVRELSGRRRGAAGGQGQRVTPSMPAVVVSLAVEPGQGVQKGQALLVISAMKMETTLVAPYAGIVQAVSTEVGAKVAPGDVLVEIEAHQEASHD